MTEGKRKPKVKVKRIRPILPSGRPRWARLWDKCQVCGLQKHEHQASGVCRKCYQRQYYRIYMRDWRKGRKRVDRNAVSIV